MKPQISNHRPRVAVGFSGGADTREIRGFLFSIIFAVSVVKNILDINGEK
jgi:hypothetical protein